LALHSTCLPGRRILLCIRFALGLGLSGVPLRAWSAPVDLLAAPGSALVISVVVLLLLAAALLYRRQLQQLSARTRLLQLSEARYRMIVEGANVVVWEYDIGSNAFTYMSGPGEQLLGFPLEAWRQSGFWLAHLHPADRDRVLAFLRDVMVSGLARECEYRMLAADGGEIHVRDLRAPNHPHETHVIGMRGIWVDVSVNKASKAAVEDSEARFQGIFEQAAVGFCLSSLAGRYLRVNQRYCAILGYTEAELLTKEFRELTHPDDQDANERLLQSLLGGEAQTLTHSIEKRMVRRDGTHVWVNLTLSQVPSWREHGQFMEVIEDITARKHAENELRESEGRLRTILAAMREGVIMRDARGAVIIANAAARRLYGLEQEESFPPLQEPEGYSFVREDGSACPIEELPGARARYFGSPAAAVVGIDRRDGSRGWMLAKAEPLDRDPHTGLHPVVLTLNDLTAQRRAEEELRLAATVFDHSVEAILITDAQRRILSVNKAFCALTGFSAEMVLGKAPEILASSLVSLRYYDEIWREAADKGSWQGEIWQCRRDGTDFPEWFSVAAVRDRANTITHYVAVFSDITERKASEARIAFLAHHDPLTTLPNRTLFQDRLEQALVRAERQNGVVALLFLDLDRFKTINDSLGHMAGDRLLQSVAERLRHCVRDADTICRQGGDEFIIVLPEIADVEAPARVADKILRRLAEPFEVDGHMLGTSFSIGISVYPNDGVDASTLMKNADTAMYHAKENGRNTYRFFTEAMNANAMERLQIENHLRLALDHGELSVCLQPQVRLESGAIVGCEALVRWNSSTLGNVPPERFIPIAEESGLIVPIGRWVLREACRFAVGWYNRGVRQVVVAVNISALQFRRDDIVMAVKDVLNETGLSPECLELELTESLLMENAEDVLETVQRLKSLGVRLSIDDFGTGYSSLSYLKRFAVDRLKIDQGFVRDMVDDPDDAAIVRAIIQLGRSLKLDVIAEGAESRAQVDFLMREGCREAQGYFFCPPVSNDVFMDMLARGLASAGQETLPFSRYVHDLTARQ